MKLPPDRLNAWLNEHHFATPPIAYDLAASTGPVWTLDELLGDQPLPDLELSYVHSKGGLELREAIADMAGVEPHQVQITTGAAEALWILFMLAADARRQRRRPGTTVLPDLPGGAESARHGGPLVHDRAGRPRRPQHPPDPRQPPAQPHRRRDVRRRPRPAPRPRDRARDPAGRGRGVPPHLPRPRPVLRLPAAGRDRGGRFLEGPLPERPPPRLDRSSATPLASRCTSTPAPTSRCRAQPSASGWR